MGMPLVCARAKRLASGSSFCISRHNIGSNAWMQVQSCLDRPIGIFAMRQPMASVDDDIQMIRDLIEWSGDNAAQIARKIGRSEEHTSELQSLMRISYAVFCLKKQQ